LLLGSEILSAVSESVVREERDGGVAEVVGNRLA